jgi:hypothetical protein
LELTGFVSYIPQFVRCSIVVYRVSEAGIDGGSHNQAPPQQLHYDVNRILVTVKFLYFIHIKVIFL